jgi:hypothetical protein
MTLEIIEMDNINGHVMVNDPILDSDASDDVNAIPGRHTGVSRSRNGQRCATMSRWQPKQHGNEVSVVVIGETKQDLPQCPIVT